MPRRSRNQTHTRHFQGLSGSNPPLRIRSAPAATPPPNTRHFPTSAALLGSLSLHRRSCASSKYLATWRVDMVSCHQLWTVAQCHSLGTRGYWSNCHQCIKNDPPKNEPLPNLERINPAVMVCTKSLLFAGILSLASSLAVDYVPVATAISNNGASFNLSPTPAPAPDELRRRQASQITVQTLLAAPDNTCGYFQGNSDAPWGCSTGNCVFATPTAAAVSNGTKGAGGVLCCDPKTGCPAAPAATACVGRDDYNKTCTGSCTSDPATLKCTSGIYLWCNTVTFTTPNISAFFCNYISTTDPLPAQTAFPGQAGHALTTTVAKFATTPAPSTSLPSSLKSPTGTHSASATAGASTGGAGKSNKGAVIGGAVGGVLGLALIAGAVIMFLRWRNSREPDQGQKGAASSTEEVSAPATAKAEPVVTARPK